jgi:hypothetical protein
LLLGQLLGQLCGLRLLLLLWAREKKETEILYPMAGTLLLETVLQYQGLPRQEF